MSFFENITYSCKEATLLSLKKEEIKLTRLQKIKLFAHLVHCKYCRLFLKQAELIEKSAKNIHQQFFKNPPYTLSDESKKVFQKEIDKLNNK